MIMRIPRFLRALILCFVCLTVHTQGLAEQSVETESSPWVLDSLDGNTVHPFADDETQAIVLIFISTDCPIANTYHPLLKELEREFRDNGIEFYLVHSTAGITAADARRHADDFDLTIPVILDGDQSLARRVEAKVTPEAIVLQRGGDEAVYRGKIDDLYEGYGKKRRTANKHYLKDALDQILTGKEISVSSTKPIGCYISYASR